VASSSPPPSRPRRKGGAQPRNRNALKHALYARYYPDETRDTLLTWESTDFIAEAHLLRASLDSMAQLLLGQPDLSVADKVSLLNGIARACNTLTLLVQRNQLLNSRDDPVYIAWEETTRDLAFFTDGQPPE
jgi:hypothetical protein